MGRGWRRGAAAIVATAALTVGLAGLTPLAPTASAATNTTPRWDQSTTPYRGWSSWSLQATKADGVNPNGDYSWLTEDHVRTQAAYMAKNLKKYGYTYVNMDAGWWRTWNWTPVYDDYGRPAVWSTRFPSGMKSTVSYIHSLGLKAGIYLPAGMETGKEGDTKDTGQDLTKTIYGAPQCTLADALYDDLRTTNGWNSAYALDFEKDNGCATAYVQSMVDLFESWGGVDFLKIDGVGPGSGHTDISGDNVRYDNRTEIAAYDKAFQATRRHVEIQVSWAVDEDYIADWQASADSWRSSWDVESYGSTLTQWSSVESRLTNSLDWAQYAGPTTGWTNLDSLEIGNGTMDGLTDTERKTTMAMWSLASAPLYLGDELTTLDTLGKELATNTDLLSVDSDPNASSYTLVAQDDDSYTVARTLKNGDVVVGLFNLGDTAATVATTVSDAYTAVGKSAGGRRAYAVKDLFTHRTSQTAGAIAASLPAHGSAVYRISTDPRRAQQAAPLLYTETSAAADSLAPGGSTVVSVQVHNAASVPAVNPRVRVSAPTGWTVKPARRVPHVIPGRRTATVTFTATAPSSATSAISAATLTTTATAGHGAVAAESTVDLSVVAPLDDTYATANTTGSAAQFGQLGSTLAINAAGSNVGPATQGPNSASAGDAYGAIYLKDSAVGDSSTVSATVTAQNGGSAAKAGIMVRDDFDADGSNVGAALYLSNGYVQLAFNNTDSGGTAYTSTLGGGNGPWAGSTAVPVTLRLVRDGTSYTGSYSTDGSTWTDVGTVTLAGQGDSQQAGVFQSAASTTPAVAEFSDLSVS